MIKKYDTISRHIQYTETAVLYGRRDVGTSRSPTNGRSESSSVEWDQPLYSVTLLHQRSLVHGPDPAIHVLLCVRTEEICPHPAVFCLWANHRVLIVNVGAHSCMARLSKGERGREGERERMDVRTENAAREADEWKTLLSCLLRLTAVNSERTKFTATFYWNKKSCGSKVLQQKQCEHCCFWPQKKHNTGCTFHLLFKKASAHRN